MISGGFIANAKPKKVALRMVKIRADGTREDLGLKSYYHRNPLIRVVVNLWIKAKEAFR